MLKTHHGSSHCGAVKFEADIDLSAGTSKCNCSICTKNRGWNAQVKPQAFRLLSDPASLSDYQFGSNSAHHVFCMPCQVSAFGDGHVEEIGGRSDSGAIACLAELPPPEHAALPVQHMVG